MELDKFVSNISQKMKVFKYIYRHRRFFLADIKKECKLPHSTINRYLEGWFNEKLLERSKNGDFYEYKTTPN